MLGDIAAVTACGTAAEFAWTAATKTNDARRYSILRLKGGNIDRLGSM